MNYITEKELAPNKKTKDEYVALVIEDDGSGVPWEGGINGRFYRISRGTEVAVPKNLAKLISLNSRVSRISELHTRDYRSQEGKRLG